MKLEISILKAKFVTKSFDKTYIYVHMILIRKYIYNIPTYETGKKMVGMFLFSFYFHHIKDMFA